jgi:leucyl/phenylalanyl-tRNA--protein transferase
MNHIESLINAYINGFFPMADNITNEISYYCPLRRAVFPIYNIRTHKSFEKFLKRNPMSVTIDKDFSFVINSCANRKETWISEEIISWYIELHSLSLAHSVEVWYDNVIVGGLYGVTIGGAFFGESMFSTISNASKVAFYFLIEHLKRMNFELLDSQFINEHTKLLGAVEISSEEYMQILDYAVRLDRIFI